MDSGPPLNLSTSVKVEDGPIPMHSKITEEQCKNETFVYLQIEDKETEALTITGEAIDSGPHNNTDSNEPLEDASLKESLGTLTYKCPACPKEFNRASQLRHHIKSHVDKKVHKCKQCSMEFPLPSQLISHFKEHFVKRTYECKDCKIPMPSYTSYRLHMKKHRNEKKFKCLQCPMSFMQHSHLQTHMRKHTGEKPYTCGVCQTSFKQVSHLTTHLRIHTNDRPYVCDVCNAAFSQTGSLKRHKRSHTGEKPYKCEQCNAVFVEKRNLSRHLLSHSGIRPFSCDLCSASFTQMIDLKRHKLSHSGIKPFKCDICDAAFSRKNNLKWHKMTHEGDTPHVCEICNVGFRIPRDLKSHKRTHIENRPYPCKLCKASFAQVNTLKRHELVHSGTKPFSCDQCKASFFEKSAVKRHMLRHKNVKPFACDRCPTTFLELRAFKRHKIMVHHEGNYEDTALNYEVVEGEIGLADTKNQIEGTIDPLQRVESQQAPLVNNEHPPMSLKQENDTFTALAVANGSETGSQFILNDFNGQSSSQVPTLVLSQPGQPPKTGRAAGNCQNHDAHVHTILEGSFNQWQAWCFCDIPNIPSSLSISEGSSSFQDATTTQSFPLPSISHLNQPLSVVGRPVTAINKNDEAQISPKTSAYHNINNPQEHSSSNSYQGYNSSITYSANQLGGSIMTDSPVIEPNSINNSRLNDITTSNAKPNYLIPDPNALSLSLNNAYTFPAINTETKKAHNLQVSTENKIVGSNMTTNKNIVPGSILTTDVNGKLTSYHHQSNSLTIDHAPFLYEDSDDPKIMAVSGNQNGSAISSNVQSDSTTDDNAGFIQNSIPEPSSSEAKDQVTLQYSLTVNNPATGEIQIQSDLFPVKSANSNNSTVPVPPIKKRKLAKGAGQPVKKLQCPYCPKTFTKQGPLEMHARSHTGEKLYICGVCNLNFSHNNSLIIHMRSHTGERPYSCIYCSATFTQKSNLRVHHRTHTGEKPFKCDACVASFAQGSHLKAHKRIHNNDRPYVCPTCGQAFTQNSALRRHQLKHTGIKAYSCTECSGKFSQKDDLRKHILSHLNSKNRKDSKAYKNDDQSSKPKDVDVASFEMTEPATSSSSLQVQATRKPSQELATIEEEKESFKNDENKLEKVAEEEPKETFDSSTPVPLPTISNDEIPKNELKKDSLVTKAPRNQKPVPSDSSTSDTFHSPVSKKEKEKPEKVVNKEIKKLQFEPTRTSRRIKEAAERKKFKVENSDFITGDLNEIDKVEALEDEMAKFRTKKKAAQIVDSDQVQSWCFCEVPHKPNEPHTSELTSKEVPVDSQIVKPRPETVACVTSETGIPVINTNGGRTEVISSYSLPQNALVLQSGDQHENLNYFNSGGNVILNSNFTQILGPNATLDTTEPSGVATATQMIPTSSGTQLIPVQQNGSCHQNDKDAYASTQVISSQVLTGGQIITSDGTFYIDANDLINNGAVVLNSSPGTFLFDIGPEGQLLNVPIGTNLGSEMILPGTTVVEASGNAYVPSASINSATTLTDSGSIIGTHAVGLNNIQYASLDNGTMFGTVVESVPESVPKKPLKQESKPVVVNPSKCSVCPKVFAQRLTLKQHMELAHPGLLYCSACFESFTSKEHLNTHKLQHTSAFTCPECSQQFTAKVTLTQHRQKIHNVTRFSGVKKDQRTFVCTHCDSRFYQLSDLRRHNLSHTGEKPFKCKVCNACFTRKFSLKKHERIHTGERPYLCQSCPETFAYRHQYNRHCSAVHPELQKEAPASTSSSATPSSAFFS